jgi:hypothetical protein
LHCRNAWQNNHFHHYGSSTATINENLNKKAISDNGIFRPIIVLNGQVVGIWKRETQKAKVVIEANLFCKVTAKEIELIVQEAEKQALFLAKPVEVVFKNSYI